MKVGISKKALQIKKIKEIFCVSKEKNTFDMSGNVTCLENSFL